MVSNLQFEDFKRAFLCRLLWPVAAGEVPSPGQQEATLRVQQGQATRGTKRQRQQFLLTVRKLFLFSSKSNHSKRDTLNVFMCVSVCVCATCVYAHGCVVYVHC